MWLLTFWNHEGREKLIEAAAQESGVGLAQGQRNTAKQLIASVIKGHRFRI